MDLRNPTNSFVGGFKEFLIRENHEETRSEPEEPQNEPEEPQNNQNEIKNDEMEEFGNDPDQTQDTPLVDDEETGDEHEAAFDPDPDSSPTGELKNEDEGTTVLGPEKKDEVITEADFEKAEKKSVKRFGFFRK